MPIHPEVLWAQRSSESDEKKVRDLHFASPCEACILTIATFTPGLRLVECFVYHGKPARHPARLVEIQPFGNQALVRGESGQVSAYIGTSRVVDACADASI